MSVTISPRNPSGRAHTNYHGALTLTVVNTA